MAPRRGLRICRLELELRRDRGGEGDAEGRAVTGSVAEGSGFGLSVGGCRGEWWDTCKALILKGVWEASRGSGGKHQRHHQSSNEVHTSAPPQNGGGVERRQRPPARKTHKEQTETLENLRGTRSMDARERKSLWKEKMSSVILRGYPEIKRKVNSKEGKNEKSKSKSWVEERSRRAYNPVSGE